MTGTYEYSSDWPGDDAGKPYMPSVVARLREVHGTRASEARAGAAEARRKAYAAMKARWVLEPTSPRTRRENLWQREQTFLPGFIGTIGWPEASVKAFYGL